MLTTAIVALTTFFVIIDPIGTSAAGAALTHSLGVHEARKIYIKAVLIAFLVCLFFGVLGESILHHAGISLSAFRVAGGLLLFVTGFRMLLGQHDQEALTSKDTPYADRSDVAVFPLAIPLMSGPGCITALLLLQAESTTTSQMTVVWGSLIFVLLITLVCFFMARRVLGLLGTGLVQIVVRIMGLLLAALAVQFIVDGVKTLFIVT